MFQLWGFVVHVWLGFMCILDSEELLDVLCRGAIFKGTRTRRQSTVSMKETQERAQSENDGRLVYVVS